MKDLGKVNLLGVLVDAVDYDAAASRIITAAKKPEPFAATALAVHGIMTGAQDATHRQRLNRLDLLAPDGHPVRWAQNLLHHTHLTDRVYGPFLMLRVLERAAAEGLPVYFYGAAAETLVDLDRNMRERFPDLKVAGWEEGQYTPERPGERQQVVERLRDSGARIVFVGLGVPRQEAFVYGLRDAVGVPMLAVGAAFDYHAGKHQFPPAWVQRRGLEWLWRLASEPRRLWRRYVLLNPQYVAMVALQASRLWKPETQGPAPARDVQIDL